MGQIQYKFNKNDEYFTPEYAIYPIIKYLKPNSIIWCPFDKEESKFVEVFRKESFKVIHGHIETGQDFFKVNVPECDYIISNPPYSLAKEFVEKGIEILSDDGKMAMFLKIQFLEGEKRIEMFKKYPPRYIYVFSKRMATWNNGERLDPNGKKWATTMCHAWFIWEKGFKGEPVVRWLY